MYYLIFSLLPVWFLMFPLPVVAHVPMLRARYMDVGSQADLWMGSEIVLNAFLQAAVSLALLSFTFSLIESVLRRLRRTDTASVCRRMHYAAAEIGCTFIIGVVCVSYMRANILHHY